ncbi:phage virion morphogenesis protein [uncultured Shewanella sp.]|uniref:phage virion morphogenesis protein n=1 Tax=uncultured Shewanella sp. TaxID=173975 RepID=UPI00260C7197|nr:phage virion morphogenesis protein [uncultured Shewanella sp.]
MAGTHIDITARGQVNVAKALNKLLRQGQNLNPILGDIAEYLLESTQGRFIDQQAPDGKPWQPLSPDTLFSKELRQKRVDRILTESGTLADTLNYQLAATSFRLGSPLEYAATHQLGRDEANIVQRPFLGLAPFERVEIMGMLNEYLSEAL